MDKLLIKNTRILDPAAGLDQAGDLLVEDGRISSVGPRLDCPDAYMVDGAGLCTAPGLVDIHVHLRDPGFLEKEDIASGCRAAAAGGVTSLLCMPNTRPVIDSPEVVRGILERAKGASAHVAVAAAITKGLLSGELSALEELKQAGAWALSDDGRPVLDGSLMAQAMQMAPKLGLFVTSHCEDLTLTRNGRIHEGAVSRKLGVPGVPSAAENCGTARELALAASYRVPVHICHVSTKESVALIREAKARGVAVTAETAPHYFALTDQELFSRDADYRMSPPLRTEEDRQAILAGLCDGTLDAIATDHAPHTPQEKADFLTAPNGVIGMETSLAAGITFLVETGHMSLLELLRKMSEAPARLLGLPAGRLQTGMPADLVLFDPKQRWTVSPDRLHGKSRNAVFKGRTLTGRVKMTILEGRVVYRDQEGE